MSENNDTKGKTFVERRNQVIDRRIGLDRIREKSNGYGDRAAVRWRVCAPDSCRGASDGTAGLELSERHDASRCHD